MATDELKTTDRPAFIVAPYCRSCQAVGMAHCSDPINCGGTPPAAGYRWRPKSDDVESGWVLLPPPPPVYRYVTDAKWAELKDILRGISKPDSVNGK